MRIVLIGTGNVATRMGMALRAKNADIIQVFGRSETETPKLAVLLGSTFTTDRKKIATNADIYIIAVSDDAIADVSAELRVEDQLVVHTSGSVSMEVLAPKFKNYGVLYPLQTLSKQKDIDFSSIPVCIEANNEKNLVKLQMLASSISDQVIRMDSLQRRQLHLAAVFVCNFANHLFSIGEEILQEQNIDFSLLRALIQETAAKVMQFSPHDVQTGPAIRGDKVIMESHLKMLEKHPEWQKLYELMSRDIQKGTGGLDDGMKE